MWYQHHKLWICQTTWFKHCTLETHEKCRNFFVNKSVCMFNFMIFIWQFLIATSRDGRCNAFRCMEAMKYFIFSRIISCRVEWILCFRLGESVKKVIEIEIERKRNGIHSIYQQWFAWRCRSYSFGSNKRIK